MVTNPFHEIVIGLCTSCDRYIGEPKAEDRANGVGHLQPLDGQYYCPICDDTTEQWERILLDSMTDAELETFIRNREISRSVILLFRRRVDDDSLTVHDFQHE